MKKGFVALAFLIAICLTACSNKIPPVEDRLPVSETMGNNPENSISQEETEDAENEKIQIKSILQVQTDIRLGSGVLWEKLEEEWIVVTAAHVVEGLQEVDVYLVPEDKILPATVEVVEGLDLAFLRVSIRSLAQKTKEEYGAVQQMQDAIEEGATVFAKGYTPYGELCEFVGKVLEGWIYVQDFDNHMLICDCQASSGMSGGAAVTENGGLAGLICGENDNGVLAVLPVTVIRSEYELFLKN
jgi:S1-C subfamily serine protease